MSKYNKFIIALVGAAVAILVRHFGADNQFVLDAITLATALGVYAVPNVN